MSADSLDRLEQLFRSAQLHPTEERSAFLDAACADDPVLRAEIESLLEADAEADSDAFLAEPPTEWDEAIEAAETAHTINMLEGRQIGPYRVLRELSQGGMGDVYLGVREEPFRRYVALKVIRRGTDSRDVIARFAIERQILASLDHPGIARLLDGGMTDDGLPYFAMEYVEGQPITAYCDERRLTIPERLRLFVQVCEAVHVAHQNLILHRDLKPSNILVTANGNVKLLDFGIAKLLNPQMSHLTVPVTRAETRMLTPEYASPEQIRGEPLTTTSDVYSLGVLLYELLAGHRPHRLVGRSTQEMIQIVSNEAPVNPSTAVSRATTVTGAEHVDPNDVATARNLTPDRLQRRLRGDLDAISLKTLRKEPNHRYGSAELLAQDIERHLAREPVSARRGNRRYRMAAFLRRHRVETTAALIVLTALLGGLGVALWQAGEARSERDRAQTAAAKVEEVSVFLVSLFEQADPTEAIGDTLTVRQVLDDGAARIESELEGQPEVQASLFSVIANAYHNLGHYDRSVGLMERAVALRQNTLAPGDEETLGSLYDLGQFRVAQGDFHGAEEAFRSYVSAATERYGEQDVRVLKGTYRIWGTLHQQGQRASADSLFSILLAMEDALPDEDHEDRAYLSAEIGYILMVKQEYAEAEDHFRQALAMRQRLQDGPHPELADVQKNLANVINLQGRHAEAELHALEAARISTLLFPEGHDQVLSSLFHLALIHRDLQRYDEAEQHLLNAIAMLRRLHGTQRYALTQYLDTLSDLHERQGHLAEAEAVYREIVALTEERVGTQAPATLSARAYLGNNLRLQQRFNEAETVLLDSYRRLMDQAGAEHRFTRRVAQHLADLYDVWERPDEAARYRAIATDTKASSATG